MSEEICLFVLSPQTDAKGPFGETDFRGDMTDGWEVGLGIGVGWGLARFTERGRVV